MARIVTPASKLVRSFVALLVGIGSGQAQRVDPTFLHRYLPTVVETKADLTTTACHYKPLFGRGDADTSIVVGIARYGEATLDPGGACAMVNYPDEEQVYVVVEGSGVLKYGGQSLPAKKEDYFYLPAAVPHSLENPSGGPLRAIVMGFRLKGPAPASPPHPLEANIEDVPLQGVKGHPDSTQYRLLMGDVESKRDKIAAGHTLTSLFVMEIAAGGTNKPHHHQREEEIYLLLDGHGEMVAGGGTTGIEGRYPAQPGDAYFFRLNCTVGFYSAPAERSRVLAVRSWYPGMEVKGMEH